MLAVVEQGHREMVDFSICVLVATTIRIAIATNYSVWMRSPNDFGLLQLLG